MTCCESKIMGPSDSANALCNIRDRCHQWLLNTFSDAEFVPVLSIRKYFLLYYIVNYIVYDIYIS